jgi:hypothetical protein
MKAFSCLTETHKPLLPYFVGSFPFEEGLDLQIQYLPQDCLTGEYLKDGWADAMKTRMVALLSYLEQLKYGDLLLNCDVDIQFFGLIKQDLINVLGDNDFAIQLNHPGGQVCNGFFVCKKTDRVLDLLKTTISMIGSRFNCDQPALNTALKEMNYPYVLLPNRYYTTGHHDGDWNGAIPKDIVMHHANWTVGIENKIKLLQFVRSKVNESTQ